MKSVIKNRFALMQKFSCVMLCIAFFAAFGCSKSNSSLESEFEQSITYPEIGILGYPNILAEGFVEANHDKISSLGEAINVYSMKAELPKGNSSLKIVIKSVKSSLYVCSLCRYEFPGLHEACPECGGVDIFRKSGNEWGIFSLHITGNWFGTAWDDNLQGNTFTVYESGKPADAIVMFWNDCIIEYYENGAVEPTKVKEIKVID